MNRPLSVCILHPSYAKLFVPEKALQQQLEKILPLRQNIAKERGSPANFRRFGIILKDDRQNFTRVTEPTREQRNQADRPTRLVPTTPLRSGNTNKYDLSRRRAFCVVIVGMRSYKVTFLKIGSFWMAKKATKRRAWTIDHVRTLKTMARQKKKASRIAKALKRSEGATRQKAFSMGLSLDSRV